MELILFIFIFPFIFIAGLWIFLSLFIDSSEKKPLQENESPALEVIASEKTLSEEKKEAQTPETLELPYSTCGVASCVLGVLFWIIIILAVIAQDALQPKVKHFLSDPISYTLERIFFIFLEPFVEFAKASIIASGAGMLAALILGIIGFFESKTDKAAAILGCVMSGLGLIPALTLLF